MQPLTKELQLCLQCSRCRVQVRLSQGATSIGGSHQNMNALRVVETGLELFKCVR